MRGSPGADLRALREGRNLTLKDLAKRAGVSFSVVGHIERGGNTTLERLDALAAAVGAEIYVAVYDPAESAPRVLNAMQSDFIDAVDSMSPNERGLLVGLAHELHEMGPELRDLLAVMVERAKSQRTRRASGES